MTMSALAAHPLGRSLALLTLLALLAPRLPAQADDPPPQKPNILLMVADDLGTDNVSVLGAHPDPAPTPNLDALALSGVRFLSAWANPVCSPTRATILTGRYGWRTGMGSAISGPLSGKLKQEEVTLPEVLNPLGYACAAVGKWHLGNDPQSPLQAGFLHHRGSISSIPDVGGYGDGYYHYSKAVDGVPTESFTYATTETVDDALEFAATLPEPWFLYVCFNAPHVPFHKPPPELHPYTLPEEVAGNEPIHAKAMVAAMDTEIGRLMQGIDLADTVVIFTSDNGPDPRAVTAPWNPTHVKGSVYEHGVRVPLFAAGQGVFVGGRCGAIVNTTDLFATVVELAGGDPGAGLDAVSMVPYFSAPLTPPLREFVYAETFMPNFDPAAGTPGIFARHKRAVRGKRFKLVHEYDNHSPQLAEGGRQMYDLIFDRFELFNLLDFPLGQLQAEAYQQLQVAMVELGPPPWADLGEGLAGGAGEPQLTGHGTLVQESPLALQVTNAAPATLGFLVVGLSPSYAPFAGGTIVPSLDNLLLLPTDENGSLLAATSCPPFLPPALPLLFQYWLPDVTAPMGWAASNGLVGFTPP